MKLIIPIIHLILSPFAYSQIDYSASAAELKENKIRKRIELGLDSFTEFQDTTTIEIIDYNREGDRENPNSTPLPNNNINSNNEIIVWETLPDGTKRKASTVSSWYDEIKADSLVQTVKFSYTEFGKIQRVLNSHEYLTLKDKFESEAHYIYNEKKLIAEIQYRQGKGKLVAKSLFIYETY